MVKNPSANAGDSGSIPGLGRSPGGGHGNPLQYYCLENPKDRGAWWATAHEVVKSDVTEQLNNNKQQCAFNQAYSAKYEGKQLSPKSCSATGFSNLWAPYRRH